MQSLTNLFPLWVTLGAIISLIHPPSFMWFSQSYIPPTLSMVMLGMSLTLPFSTLIHTLTSRPRQIIIGVVAQYTIMPILGYTIAQLFQLPVAISAGLILVSVCPGGAASNIVCLLANADVSLSIILTLISTLLSIFMIPLLMSLLSNTFISVNVMAMLISTSQIVLLPLVLGSILQKFIGQKFINIINIMLPLISVIGVTLICASVVAMNSTLILSSNVGLKLILAIACLHSLGALLGFLIGKSSRLKPDGVRTVTVEVMMQNSSLAVTLANAHLGGGVTAVPGAISATMHSIFGSFLAAFWRHVDRKSIEQSNKLRKEQD